MNKILLALILSWFFLAPRARAQDLGGGVITISSGGGSTVLTGTLSTGTTLFGQAPVNEGPDYFAGILPTAGVVGLDVTPGSTLVLNLVLGAGTGATAVDSFSVSFADEPFLTLQNVESALPNGWSTATSASSFSGQNANGSDLSGDSINLAELVYEVADDAPVGTVLTLPGLTNSSFLDANGSPIETGVIGIASGYGATVVAAPEPVSLALGGIASLLFLALRFRVARAFGCVSGRCA